MEIQSNFKSDLEKEQRLSVLLDAYYTKNLKHYAFKRIHDLKLQLQGVDVIFTHSKSGDIFHLDEKAQLDYVNEELPTFAFELGYQKRGVNKKGWWFDSRKKTDFYSLITGIYTDEPDVYTTCKITFVNRKKLIAILEERGLIEKSLLEFIETHGEKSGKLAIEGLHPASEGYLYFSSKSKAEKPINLVLKLNFLIQKGVAKRFV